MGKPVKIILPFVIILVAVVLAKVLVSSRPPAERQSAAAPAPVVQMQVVQPEDYAIRVSSRGVVQARTQVTLVSQVSGEVVRVSPGFRDGGFFTAGETLLQIDPRDYQAAVTIADSEIIQARQALAEEEARANQAELDWQRLGGDNAASDLTLRKPQLASARARLSAAEARLAQARLNLARTRISLPYDGRVLSQMVDIGQVINAGAVLGEVYATDAVEVRLPLSNRQLAQLTIPEQYPGQDASVAGPAVLISARVGDESYQWEGRVVRSEGAIDSGSRQTFVVARFDDPYKPRDDGRPPLKVGQYVEAAVVGNTLQNVFILPASAIRGEVFAYVLEAGNTLTERSLDIVWRSDNEVVVRAGIKAGEKVVTTVPAGAASGMKVRLPGEPKPESAAAAKGSARP